MKVEPAEPVIAAPERVELRPALPDDLGPKRMGLPGWPGDNGMAGLDALRVSCDRWADQPDEAPISTRVDYAGTVGDWREVCINVAAPDDLALAGLENLLVPLEIVPDDRNRFTGYFEPEIDARRTPSPPFTEPVPGVPDTLVRGQNGDVLERDSRGQLSPYPARADIDVSGLPALGYAHPADVFFLQIQGSGRLRFEDGTVIRAAFAAHNDRPFRGIANWLLERGEITRGEAGMDGVRAWMDRAPKSRVREAMNANPRFVFFSPEPVGDPTRGPVGAMGVPLTALGSVAVDTDLHPLGIPIYLETNLPRRGESVVAESPFRGFFVAQDTGGAIKGPVRADIYFGTGAEAGFIAGRQNAQGRMWVLIPVSVAQRRFELDRRF